MLSKNKFPKIYIHPSNIIFWFIKREYRDKEWYKLKLSVKKFDNFFQKYKKPIVKLIAKYMTANWTENKIDIWLSSPAIPYPSLSGPPIIKLRKDFKFTIYVLIHELIHVFFQSNKIYKKFKPSFNADYRIDVFVDYIAYKILEDLFGEKELVRVKKLKRKIFTSQNFKEHENKIKMLEKKINLKQKPFYRWIKLLKDLEKNQI